MQLCVFKRGKIEPCACKRVRGDAAVPRRSGNPCSSRSASGSVPVGVPALGCCPRCAKLLRFCISFVFDTGTSTTATKRSVSAQRLVTAGVRRALHAEAFCSGAL